MSSNIIGQNIRRIRKENELDAYVLAKRLGFSDIKLLYYIETSDMKFTDKDLDTLCKALKCNKKELTYE